uniref:MyTH4 domain-containing protein n=1 Tax=Ditylenchus dipsaci TaxID=166011 RepID=A0A915CMC6_9BILA
MTEEDCRVFRLVGDNTDLLEVFVDDDKSGARQHIADRASLSQSAVKLSIQKAPNTSEVLEAWIRLAAFLASKLLKMNKCSAQLLQDRVLPVYKQMCQPLNCPTDYLLPFIQPYFHLFSDYMPTNLTKAVPCGENIDERLALMCSFMKIARRMVCDKEDFQKRATQLIDRGSKECDFNTKNMFANDYLKLLGSGWPIIPKFDVSEEIEEDVLVNETIHRKFFSSKEVCNPLKTLVCNEHMRSRLCICYTNGAVNNTFVDASAPSISPSQIPLCKRRLLVRNVRNFILTFGVSFPVPDYFALNPDLAFATALEVYHPPIRKENVVILRKGCTQDGKHFHFQIGIILSGRPRAGGMTTEEDLQIIFPQAFTHNQLFMNMKALNISYVNETHSLLETYGQGYFSRYKFRHIELPSRSQLNKCQSWFQCKNYIYAIAATLLYIFCILLCVCRAFLCKHF